MKLLTLLAALLISGVALADCPGGVCPVQRPVTAQPVYQPAPTQYTAYQPVQTERRRILPNFQPFGGRFRPNR